MRAYLIISGTAGILLAMTYVFSRVANVSWINHYLVIMAFLTFLTFVSDMINKRALNQEGRGVIIPYLISTVLKLIFSAIFLLFFIKQNMDMAREIVFSFLIYYAVFSALEIVIVNKRLRLKKF